MTAIPDAWYGLPRNYYSGGNFFPGDPSNRHLGDFGKMLGAQYRTKTYDTVMVWSLPSIETYDSYLGVVAQDLPARPVINGQAAETGGPLWAAERDGAERLRNVEHLRGLAEADVTEALLTKPINEPPTNPWSTSGSLPVWPARLAAANPAYSELNTNVDVVAPPSEMQGFYETLRRHYQSEETAQKLDERDRSVSMPPRTLADANPQLNGWMAQVALTKSKLEINDDTMRRADSGKTDDGGKAETKMLAAAYSGNPDAESEPNKRVGGGAPNAGVNEALKDRVGELLREILTGKPYFAYQEGLVKGFVEDGLIGTLQGIRDIPGVVIDGLQLGFDSKLFLITKGLEIVIPGAQGFLMPASAVFAKRHTGTEALELLKKTGATAIDGMLFVAAVQSDLFKLTLEQWVVAFTGNAYSPELKLSPESQLVLSVVGEPLGKLASYIANKMTATEAAGLLGRVVGNIAYEVAEGLLTDGIGTALKSAKVAKLARRLEKVAHILEEIPALKGSPKIKEVLGDLLFAMKYALTTSMCFVAGTKIHTQDGLKNIEQIRAEDLVLSRSESDSEDKRPHYKRVVATFVTRPIELFHVEYVTDSDVVEVLTVTAPHPFFESRRCGFVPASELRQGDELARPEGRTATVRSIRVERAAPGERFTTYNFEVEDFHTYFAGVAGIWVHNSGTPCVEAGNHYRKIANKIDGVPVPYGIAKAKAKEAGGWLVDLMVDRVLKNERKYSPVQFKNHWKDFVDHLEDGLTDVDKARVSKQMYDQFLERVDSLQAVGAKKKATEIKELMGRDWRPFFEKKIEFGADGKRFVSGKTTNPKFPNGADNHTHHIILKEGTPEVRTLVNDTQEILVEFGIDPIFGKENLICAPNFHLPPWTDAGKEQYRKYAQAGYDMLKVIKDGPGTLAQKKDAARKTLLKLAEEWSDGKFL